MWLCFSQDDLLSKKKREKKKKQSSKLAEETKTVGQEKNEKWATYWCFKYISTYVNNCYLRSLTLVRVPVLVYSSSHSSSCLEYSYKLLVYLPCFEHVPKLFFFYFLVRSDKPHWHDILPLKLSIWLYYSLKSLPRVIQVHLIKDAFLSRCVHHGPLFLMEHCLISGCEAVLQRLQRNETERKRARRSTSRARNTTT